MREAAGYCVRAVNQVMWIILVVFIAKGVYEGIFAGNIFASRFGFMAVVASVAIPVWACGYIDVLLARHFGREGEQELQDR